MDDELRNAFATLSAQMSTINSDLRANTALTAELNSAVHQVAADQKQLRGEVKVLQRAVFGSEPPPPPPARAMVHSVTEHDGDIAEVKGELMAVRAELEVQSKKMGITANRFWAFVHNTKVQDVAKLATLAAALYAAMHGVK